MTLRVQQERLHEPALALDEYILQYQLTPERLRIAQARTRWCCIPGR